MITIPVTRTISAESSRPADWPCTPAGDHVPTEPGETDQRALGKSNTLRGEFPVADAAVNGRGDFGAHLCGLCDFVALQFIGGLMLVVQVQVVWEGY